MLRAGGPDLGAIDHIVITVGHRPALQRCQVGARARFGIALTPDIIAGADAGQIEVLLFVGAELHHHRADHAQTHGEQARRARRPGLGIVDIALHGRPAGAAMFFRPGRRDPTLFMQRLVPAMADIEFREDAGGQIGRFAHIRRQLFIEKGPHLIAKGRIRRRHFHVHLDQLLMHRRVSISAMVLHHPAPIKKHSGKR